MKRPPSNTYVLKRKKITVKQAMRIVNLKYPITKKTKSWYSLLSVLLG